MSFIEGIGDEVVLFFVIVVVFAVAALVTLIGNRPYARQMGTRQQSGRTSDQNSQALQQIYITLFHMSREGFLGPEVVTLAVRSPRNRNTENSVQSQSAEGTGEGNTENNNIENEVINDPHEEHNVEETVNGRNVPVRGSIIITPGYDSPHQAASSTTEHVNTDAQCNEDNSQQQASSSTIENSDRNTEADEGIRQSTPEIPSAPPLEDDGANDRSESSLPPPPGEIRIRLKYLNDTERTVTSNPNTKIEDFKNKHFSEDIRNNKIVRLIFAGRLLNNNSTLQNCRILDNSVVHVQILQAPTTQNAPQASQEAELDVGRLLWPVLTAVLGVCWMTYIKYPEFYNLMSLGILLLFTGSFFFFLSHAQH